MIRGNTFLLRTTSTVHRALVRNRTAFPYVRRPFHTTGQTQQNETVLVLGSSGSLGSTLSRHLSQHLNMTIIGADVLELPDVSDWEPDGFIPLPHFSTNPSLADLTERLTAGMAYCMEDESVDGENPTVDAIVCASGGWEGDPPPPEDTSKEEMKAAAIRYGDSVDRMLRMNLYPVVAAGFAASQFMSQDGLFVVMGATAALSPTPGMMGYGLSKSASHHFIQTLGAMTGRAAGHKAKRKQTKKIRQPSPYLDTMTVVGILPTMIDTPSNRDADPTADFDAWTKPIDISKEIGKWIKEPDLRPHSGSLVKVFPKPGGCHGANFHLIR